MPMLINAVHVKMSRLIKELLKARAKLSRGKMKAATALAERKKSFAPSWSNACATSVSSALLGRAQGQAGHSGQFTTVGETS